MSSWVVPSIAAELWGVSLEHVLAKVRAGEVPSREEFGFLWVEVPSQGALVGQQEGSGEAAAPRVRGRWRRGRRARATFAPRADNPAPSEDPPLAAELPPLAAELPPLAAGATDRDLPAEAVAQYGEASEGASDEDRGECESPEDPDDGLPMNWREARARVSATRRRPPS